MGSVISEMKCPQCGGSMFIDYYYKTDEEYRFCKCCGKYESWEIVRDTEGKAVRKKNGKVKYKHINHKGYGCAHIAFTNGLSQNSSFSSPIRKKDKDEFLRILESKGVDKERSCLLKWDEKTKSVVPIYGQIPKYEE